MKTQTFRIDNISCGHCIHTVKTELSDLEGVQDVSASLESKEVTVQYDEPASEAAIRSLLAEINYPAA